MQMIIYSKYQKIFDIMSFFIKTTVGIEPTCVEHATFPTQWFAGAKAISPIAAIY